ncbi:MAG TPA: L-rhamnose mutarotase [Psychromonas hadalis]|nr:L-rhamnose mutarotase [Psychromonas hadalis]
MHRKTFAMFVNPTHQEEHQKRHDEIGDEMKNILQTHGVHNYSIHLFAEQNLLFGYAEVESDEQWAAISQTEVCQKWWAYIKDITPSNEDNSPISKSLKEFFYLE